MMNYCVLEAQMIMVAMKMIFVTPKELEMRERYAQDFVLLTVQMIS